MATFYGLAILDHRNAQNFSRFLIRWVSESTRGKGKEEQGHQETKSDPRRVQFVDDPTDTAYNQQNE